VKLTAHTPAHAKTAAIAKARGEALTKDQRRIVRAIAAHQTRERQLWHELERSLHSLRA
jgi:hypothetical protein